MARIGKGLRRAGAGLALALTAGSVAFAQSPAPVLDRGDTAWVLTATALVMFMTPGLGLFYGEWIAHRWVGIRTP